MLCFGHKKLLLLNQRDNSDLAARLLFDVYWNYKKRDQFQNQDLKYLNNLPQLVLFHI